MKLTKEGIWMLALALVAVPLTAEAQTYTFIELSPSGFRSSQAWGISGGHEIGYGITATNEHALLWSGTAASAVDLQNFLPSNYLDSAAFRIDANGDIVGEAYNSSTGTQDAILWVLVPEPTTVSLLALGLGVLFMAARIRRR